MRSPHHSHMYVQRPKVMSSTAAAWLPDPEQKATSPGTLDIWPPLGMTPGFQLNDDAVLGNLGPSISSTKWSLRCQKLLHLP